MSAAALPVGAGRDRLRLFDNQFCLMYDSAVNPAPVYPYVATWINARIDRADGTYWVGQFIRCPEGVKRFSYDDRKYLGTWPDFTSAYSHDTAGGAS